MFSCEAVCDAWRRPRIRMRAAISLRLLSDEIHYRLPFTLLSRNELNGFSWRHRSRIAAARCDFFLEIRIRNDATQILARLLDDAFGGADRGHQDLPAGR